MGWGKSPAVAGSTPVPGVLAAALDVQLGVNELSNIELCWVLVLLRAQLFLSRHSCEGEIA